METLSVAFAGLGSRGKDTYIPAVTRLGSKVKIVAISDIVPEKVEDVKKRCGLSDDQCYDSAESMLDAGKLGDMMVIATLDRQHVAQAVRALRLGYHLLLEKPISPDLDECREIVRVAKEENRKVVVCHVLRYTPFYKKLKEILDSGVIGETVSVMGIEKVGYWHQAHSFVRGNWRDSNTTSPMLLQKCCHDMDLFLWLTGKTCKSVASYGSTYLFRKDKAPQGAAKRCTQGCEAKEACPFDAEKIYLTGKKGVLSGKTDWPLDVLTLHPTKESITEAIENGPYGRCVYHCDNNVVDHQVVNAEMTDGSTISFTMSAFTSEGDRYCTFMGTKGDIIASMTSNLIQVCVFGQEPQVIDVSKLASDFSGHGGGDSCMVEEFVDMLLEGREPPASMSSLEVSVDSHYMAMAAEKSRLEGGSAVLLDSMRG